jgi:hypothetical protein
VLVFSTVSVSVPDTVPFVKSTRTRSPTCDTDRKGATDWDAAADAAKARAAANASRSFRVKEGLLGTIADLPYADRERKVSAGELGRPRELSWLRFFGWRRVEGVPLRESMWHRHSCLCCESVHSASGLPNEAKGRSTWWLTA